MSSVRLFFESSTIHGLKYAAERRAPIVVRALWLACVIVGFGAAAYIVFINVAQWKANPGVVADVSSVLVRGKRWNPRITVCPVGADGQRLAFSLAERFPEAISNEVMSNFKASLTYAIILENARGSQARITAVVDRSPGMQNFTYGCRNEVDQHWTEEVRKRSMNETTNLPRLSPPCELLRILWALQVSYVGDVSSRWESLDNGLAGFLTDVSLTPADHHPTIASLERHIAKEFWTPMTMSEMKLSADPSFPPSYVYNYNMLSPFEPPDFKDMDEYRRLLHLYAFFFPVVGDDDGGVEQVKSLEDFESAAVSVAKTELGSLLRATYADGFPWYPTTTEGLLVDGLAALLGEPVKLVPSGADRADVLAGLVRYFSRPDAETVLANCGTDVRCLHRHCKSLLVSGGGSEKRGIHAACQLAQKGTLCSEYCELIALNSTTKKNMVWALEEAAGAADELGSHLPVCLHRSQPELTADCWERVVNEKGVCFTTDRGSRTEIGDGVLSEAFTFALDVRRAKPSTGDNGRFAVTVTQDNEFTRGRYAEADKTETVLLPLRDQDQGRRVADVKVKVVRHSGTTEEFAEMSPERRRCFYPHEKALAHFPVYSESNCVLECAWEAAREAAGCVPWYLSATHPDSDLCELNGMRLFEGVVEGRNSLVNQCIDGCLQDCERIEYEIETKTHEQSLSGRHVDDLAMIHELLEEKRNRSGEALQPRLQALAAKLLATRAPNLAAVNVYVDGKVALEITRTAASTPIEVVSDVGGTLGLFSGFSLISAVEVLYWVGKCLTGRRKRKMAGKGSKVTKQRIA